MSEAFPQIPEARRLRLACSCASTSDVMTDPWVAIPHDGKLNDGSKEHILNALAAQPRTIAQLANLLGISSPAVHRHVSDRLASELINEAMVPQVGRRSPVERYYQPTFAVVLAADRAQMGAEGALPPWPEPDDGSRGVWWAEEAPAKEVM